jgi:hypothetical protein
MRIIFLAEASKKIRSWKSDLLIKFKTVILNKKCNLKTSFQNLNQHSVFSRYRIEEIDIKNNKISLYCHFTRGILNTTIMEVILNQEIIKNLPINQAGTLGYLYGKLFCHDGKNIEKITHPKKNECFSLTNSGSQLKINSLDREGVVTFTDINTKEIFKKTPLEIYENEALMNKFDAIQACYIGILAGIFITKKPKHNFKKPFLTIVK